MPTKALSREEQDARVRAALVETITDRHLEQRTRKDAAKNLIQTFPSKTKNIKALMALIPRPVSEATFNACADAYHETKEKR